MPMNKHIAANSYFICYTLFTPGTFMMFLFFGYLLIKRSTSACSILIYCHIFKCLACENEL